MTSKLTREDILRKIDAVLDLDDQERVVAGCNELSIQLRPEGSTLAADERAFLAGYVLYIHPGTSLSQESRHEARTQLLLAHASTSDSSIRGRSALYLGHLLYDNGDFLEAQVWFERAMAEELQGYLGLKAVEMATCCSIGARGLQASLPAFGKFVERTGKAAMEDVWPRELARVLESAMTEPIDGDELQLLGELASALDAAGKFGRWFSEIVENGTRSQP